MQNVIDIPGKLTFRDLAVMVNMNPQLLRQHLTDKTAPQPRVAFRLGNSYIYDQSMAEEWRERFLVWRGEAPARAAARKAEADDAAARARDQEMARLKLQAQLIQGSIDAQAEAEARFKARGEEIRRTGQY